MTLKLPDLVNMVAQIFAPTPFDATKHKIPLPREKAQKKVETAKIPDGVFYDHGFGKYVTRTRDIDENATAWAVVKDTNQVPTERQRLGELTENDLQELANRGLKIEDAIIIKPYWIKEIPRKDAADTIGQKGIHQGTVGKHYAAYSAALLKNND